MIVVDFYPAGERSPFPDSSKTQWSFATHEEFKKWVQSYVCIHCLVDFYDFNRKDPETLGDWLDMGCGCEIGVTDEKDMINWDDEMIVPDNYVKMRDDHIEMMTSAFERHG